MHLLVSSFDMETEVTKHTVWQVLDSRSTLISQSETLGRASHFASARAA